MACHSRLIPFPAPHLWVVILGALALLSPSALANEVSLVIPDLADVQFELMGREVAGGALLSAGLGVCALGILFGWVQYLRIRALPVHGAMREVSQVIWDTCKTYLFQQGRFLILLWGLVGLCIFWYYKVLQEETMPRVLLILASSVLGIFGSYVVAWFGIRINTQANSRSAFASLRGRLLPVISIPLQSGMSVGILLVSVELLFMIAILKFLPSDAVGACFIAFAIGESLGASGLRICGGIFTKIADIGADLMKIAFHLRRDDPGNPGVIADCAGDNAGDSVGPTADAFETYGVTGVALVTFLALALQNNSVVCGQLIVWLFVMRVLMILTSLFAYGVNERLSLSLYGNRSSFNPESPLSRLVWITSIVSILVTFGVSYVLLRPLPTVGSLWGVIALMISCGTLAGALVPELTKVFTSTHSRHVGEVVNASRQGGVSLNVLSGLVAGNYSAFWKGLVILLLMLISYKVSKTPDLLGLMPKEYGFAAPILAFGLVAFGFLSMGPATIAVARFGPVTDNAQSVYQLSQIESVPGVREEIQRDYGFEPQFETAKHELAKADAAGNAFKSTAKPVLIGAAVLGATTMVFSIILVLEQVNGGAIAKLSLVQPEVILGVLMGCATIYWFTGASMQAVVTGAYRAVGFIKKNLQLDGSRASFEDSKEVVRICTRYAQSGMINIFAVIFCLSIALPFFDPYFFIAYLIAIAFFGLFQAVFMANAGGAWDNAKKIFEIELRQKNVSIHEPPVVGDTLGDPFKDTASVSLNPLIKFSTLFGLLAVEIAVKIENTRARETLGCLLLFVALYFVHRSFYGMRVPKAETDGG